MLLRELLSVPYIFQSVSFESEDGSWNRRFEYPELPNCTVTGMMPTEAMDTLERCKVEIILDLVERGEDVPVPRPPLYSLNAAATLRDVGLGEWLDRLDADVSELSKQN